jgi:maleamate amidohydrolase
LEIDAGKPWRESIPPEEWQVYQSAGFGRPMGWGQRPAFLVIDVQYRTVGFEPLPLMESIARYFPTSCGENGWRAVEALRPVVEHARAAQVPILYPYVAPKTNRDAGRTGEKIPGLLDVPDEGYAFVEEVAPREDDLLVPKKHASAFFGTPLVSHLVDLAVDTVVIAGCTTSGCVRATAVDACSYNFRCAVIEDCVYDRSTLGHVAGLFDMQSKYADVITASEAVERLDAATVIRRAS